MSVLESGVNVVSLVYDMTVLVRMRKWMKEQKKLRTKQHPVRRNQME